MDTAPSNQRPCIAAGLAALLATSWIVSAAQGEIATLRNGMQVEGDRGEVDGILDSKITGQPRSIDDVGSKPVFFFDDKLRRTYVYKFNLANQPRPSVLAQERIRLNQDIEKAPGKQLVAVGTMVPSPFDDWGRRQVTMRDGDGVFQVLQGISEVSPTYVRLEGLAGKNPFIWDMRVATAAVPADLLSRVFTSHLDQGNVEERLRVVRLYTQAGRYKDARDELARAIKDFPDVTELKEHLEALNQEWAKQLVNEIKLRGNEAGQHQLAYQMLTQFPADGVATETLLEVRSMVREYDRQLEQQQQVVQQLQKHIESLPEDERRARAEIVLAELDDELNIETLERMSDYLRLMGDESLSVDRRVALAMGGWMLGGGSGVQNFDVASMLVELRRLVRQYLENEVIQEREEILEQIDLLEGATPQVVARLLANMKPSPDNSDLIETSIPGLYSVRVPVDGLIDQDSVEYAVQLPPQYEPYRRYPCIVTLCGSSNTPESQIDWWAGPAAGGSRGGEAARRGYIVVAPRWTSDKQGSYEYSAREHAAVLHGVRDACRRFSIDTDRVFLSGHWMGGDAAWDIGLAHPDLWAGVLPISATADKYVVRYWKNVEGSAWYFVNGDMDGARIRQNVASWDRYLKSNKFNVMLTLYQGRGDDDFPDERPRMLEWMGLHRRTLARKAFSADSLRAWDNFFWWVEVGGFPESSNVPPLAWPKPRAREATTTGEVVKSDLVRVTTAASQATVYLLPDLVELQQEVVVVVNGSRTRAPGPSVAVILEDARTRCDRQHPFWVKVEVRAGRG